MKRYLLLFILFISLIMNCIAQTESTKTNSPKKNIQVNREYDESGNLIKFDSVYSFSWSGDTIPKNSVLPPEFQNLLGDHFNILPDSSFFGDSFFKDIDPFFNSFSRKQDSILMKNFGIDQLFQNNEFKNDSNKLIISNIDDIFKKFTESPTDSTFLKMHGQQFQNSQPKSMEDRLNLLKLEMQKMEELQLKSILEQSKKKKF